MNIKSTLVKVPNTSKSTVPTTSLAKVAELIAQMDEETLDVFISDFDIDLDDTTRDNYDRVIKRAKTYKGRYFGLVSLLLLGDYTGAKEVMTKTEAGKLDPVDEKIQSLFVSVNKAIVEGKDIPNNTITEYNQVYSFVVQLIRQYDLHSGHFRRNTKSLKEEWDELQMYHNRIIHNVQIGKALYESLWILMKFRLYIVAMMPKVGDNV